jgi:hypothetical protein
VHHRNKELLICDDLRSVIETAPGQDVANYKSPIIANYKFFRRSPGFLGRFWWRRGELDKSKLLGANSSGYAGRVDVDWTVGL